MYDVLAWGSMSGIVGRITLHRENKTMTASLLRIVFPMSFLTFPFIIAHLHSFTPLLSSQPCNEYYQTTKKNSAQKIII